MNFDEILVKYLGEFGRYQKIQFFLVCLPTIFTAMHSLSWTFTGATVPFRCALPSEVTTTDHTKTLAYRTNEKFDEWISSNDTDEKTRLENSCRRVSGVKSASDFNSLNLSAVNFESCVDGYVFNHDEILLSAIEKWNIVCDRSSIRALIQSMYYVGQFLGSFVFGILADKFGRKKSFFAAILLQITCGTLMAFVPWYPLFALLRIGVGFAHPGIFIIAVVIGMELVGPSRRLVAGVLTGLFFALGQIVLGALAYFIRDYQHLQLAISLPALIFVAYWWIVPESARWLISQKRFQEADAILQRAARINGREIPPNWYEHLETESKASTLPHKTYGFADLFKTPKIRQRIMITSFICWPAVSMVYYGLSMNPNFLGGDRYVTFMVMGFFEIPALLIVMLSLNQLGRKLICMGGFFIAAISLLGTMIIPKMYPLLMTMQVTLGKMSLCAVYAALYIFTPELFPTVIRSTAMGSCSMVARVGAVMASYISMWLVEYSKLAVVLIFGTMCLLAGSVITVLPETTGQPQFDTVGEAERFGSKQPLFSFAWKRAPATVDENKKGTELRAMNDTSANLLNDSSKSTE